MVNYHMPINDLLSTLQTVLVTLTTAYKHLRSLPLGTKFNFILICDIWQMEKLQKLNIIHSNLVNAQCPWPQLQHIQDLTSANFSATAGASMMHDTMIPMTMMQR